MTLREAQTAGGVTITPGTLIGPTSSCVEAQVGDTDIWLLTELPGVEGQDLMAGVVRAVSGGRTTVDGVSVGDPVARVSEVLGPPTETREGWFFDGGDLLVYESGGSAYGFHVDGSTVLAISSGTPNWIGATEGCA
jgi:hypothetical protein